jgi:hypothetical protein
MAAVVPPCRIALVIRWPSPGPTRDSARGPPRFQKLVIGLEMRGEFKNSDRPLAGIGPRRTTGGIEAIRRGARNPSPRRLETVTPSAEAVGLFRQLFGSQ